MNKILSRKKIVITGGAGFIGSNLCDYFTKNDNVVYMKPRLDVGKWIAKADYVVQLSDTEGDSYTIKEGLYRNIPVIVTPLPYLEEIGVKDGVNAYIMNFDGSNVQHIVDNITNIPKFNFKRMEDSYNHIFKKEIF